MESKDRMERGLDFIQKVYGSLAKNTNSVPAEIRDDIFVWATGSVFGEIWSRPGLDLKTRLLITIAVLSVLNRREGLHEHIHTALKNGVTREEICEAIFHITFLSGLPSAVESIRLAKVVFDEVDAAKAANS